MKPKLKFCFIAKKMLFYRHFKCLTHRIISSQYFPTREHNLQILFLFFLIYSGFIRQLWTVIWYTNVSLTWHNQYGSGEVAVVQEEAMIYNASSSACNAQVNIHQQDWLLATLSIPHMVVELEGWMKKQL